METAGQGAWANIIVAPEDEEIAVIDRMEKDLGELPDKVVAVRELITRFEICHFKVERHYRNILRSIAQLRPVIDVKRIGAHHPCHKGDAWKKDTTGRSEVGMRYITALCSWLGEEGSRDLGGLDEIQGWIDASLGEKSDEKVRYVNLLLDRLLGRNLEAHLGDGELSGLNLQILSCDICHYAFPQNLEKVIRGIDRLEPVAGFEGCGSASVEVTSFARQEFRKLSAWLGSDQPVDDLGLGKKEPTKTWLIACLAKTLKQHVTLEEPLKALAR